MNSEFWSHQLYEFWEILVIFIHFVAIGIILWWLLQTIWMYLKAEKYMRDKKISFNNFHNVRQEMVSYLLLALEFMIAADLIHTITSPTMENILLLALIVWVRSLISFFLQTEMKEFKTK